MTDDQPKQKPERTPENKALAPPENKQLQPAPKPRKRAKKKTP